MGGNEFRFQLLLSAGYFLVSTKSDEKRLFLRLTDNPLRWKVFLSAYLGLLLPIVRKAIINFQNLTGSRRPFSVLAQQQLSWLLTYLIGKMHIRVVMSEDFLVLC